MGPSMDGLSNSMCYPCSGKAARAYVKMQVHMGAMRDSMNLRTLHEDCMNEGARIFHLCRTGSGSILGWVCGFNQHGETFLEAWAMHVSTQCKSRAMPLGIQGQSLVIQFGLWPCSGASSPVGLHSIPFGGL